MDQRGLEQDDQFLLAQLNVAVAQRRRRARQAAAIVLNADAHQPADRHDVSVGNAHDRVGLAHCAARQGQDDGCERAAKIYLQVALGHFADRGMNVQGHHACVVDLGGDVEHDAGKKRLNLHRRGGLSRGTARDRGGGDVRDEKIVGPDFEHGFRVVHRRDAGAGEHLHRTLRIEKLQECREIGRLKREPEDGAGRIGRRQRARAQGGNCPRCGIDVDARTGKDLARGTQGCRLSGAAGDLADGGPAGIAEQRPVDPGLVRTRKRHFDDFRLEHHLPVDRDLGRLQVLFHRAMLLRHRTHHDNARLRSHHDAASLTGADNRVQCLAQVAPQVGRDLRADSTAFEGSRGAGTRHPGRPWGSPRDGARRACGGREARRASGAAVAYGA